MKKRRAQCGVTIVEVLAILTVVILLAGLLLPTTTRCNVKPATIRCVNNLKNVGLAFRIFATDHNDRYPTAELLTKGVPLSNIDALRAYLPITNEISKPEILYCPADKKRRPATSLTNITRKNLSYFVSLTAKEDLMQTFFAGDRNLQANGIPLPPGVFLLTSNTPVSWSKEMHNGQGNIVMGDGSVQQFSSSRLLQGLRDQATEVETNYLAIP